MARVFALSMFGSTQVERTLLRFGEWASDMRPAWRAIRDDFVEAEREQFDTEGRYGSGDWAPLSPAYAAWKATARPGRPILVFDGLLRASLTDELAIDVIEAHAMAVGSDVDYGLYHQHGTDRMPARPPVDLPESWRRNAVRTVQRFLVTGEAR